ncbi:MAG TPA: hypothetical protein VIK59_12920 [Verrucomicrobiae bacterium]
MSRLRYFPFENPCAGICLYQVIVALTVQEILDEPMAKKLV